MADMNRWVRTQKRRQLEELRAEVEELRDAARRRWPTTGQHGDRRAFTRVIHLIDLKLLALREEDERADSQSADDIDKGLKA